MSCLATRSRRSLSDRPVRHETAGVTTDRTSATTSSCRDLTALSLVGPGGQENPSPTGDRDATHSMDTCDKSFGGCPAPGFVPGDPTFSKALEGHPVPQVSRWSAHTEVLGSPRLMFRSTGESAQTITSPLPAARGLGVAEALTP